MTQEFPKKIGDLISGSRLQHPDQTIENFGIKGIENEYRNKKAKFYQFKINGKD